MSNALSPSFNPTFSSGYPNKDVDSSSVPFAPQNSVLSTWPSSAGPSTWQTASHLIPTYIETTNQSLKKITRAKQRTPEEQETTAQTSERFATRLAVDHATVLYPDVDSPFSDTIDVINRLLPYHIYHQPKEDLHTLISTGKGKGKASEDDVKQEISETRFAIDCFKRRAALQKRFHEVQIRPAKKSTPDDQAYVLAHAVLEADRCESVAMTNELRVVRAELERMEKEKRAAANAARPTFYASAPTTSMPSAQQQYYRPYPYAYTQAYGTTPVHSSTSTFSVASAASSTPPVSYTPVQSTGAIPVQLPVASLPALHALGIVPVPATSLPPDGQPQPPAVLRGSTSNGTMLSLEIDVSLLQSTQMSGLAMVLNSLMSRNNSGTPMGYGVNSSIETTVSNGMAS